MNASHYSRARLRTAVGAVSAAALGLVTAAGLLVGLPSADAVPKGQDLSCPYGTVSTVKVDPVAPGTYSSGGIAVTLSDLQADEDGEYGSFDFTVTGGVALYVIVKGGPTANFYDYRPAGTTSGDNLQAPINNSGNAAALSNIRFCFGSGPSSPSASPSDPYGS